jgi:tetratricopeptide (TPR) repeat protein
MKAILTTIASLLFLAFIASALYVFELPPFNPGGPLQPAAGTPSTLQQSQQMPEFLTEEKISRTKTYSEYMSRGKLLEDNGYHALAVAEYEAAGKLAPENIEPLIEIGRIHLREKDAMKAKLSFEEALRIDPNSLDAKIYLVRTLLADRKITEAQKIIAGLTEQNQNSRYYAGIISAYFGDYENSKNLLKEAVQLGTTEDITGKAKNFLSAYDEFDFNQGGAKTHLKTLLARSFNQTGEYNMAIPLLFEVIKEKKDYRDAWILLGYAYLNIEKYPDAVEALEEAKKLDPQKPETSFYLGLGYYGLNDLNRAASNLELAKKNGYQPEVQVDQKLAEIYLQLKSYEKAASSYENVLSLNDENVYYYIKPVWIYLDRLQQPAKAMALARKAYKNHPKEAMSFNLLGWAAVGTGKLDDAEDYLNKAKMLNPDLDAIYLNFGILNEKKGDLKKAVAFYRQAYTMGRGNSISSAAADRYNRVIGKTDNLNYAGADSPALPLSSLK